MINLLSLLLVIYFRTLIYGTPLEFCPVLVISAFSNNLISHILYEHLAQFLQMLWIRIDFNADPDLVFYVIADLDTGI